MNDWEQKEYEAMKLINLITKLSSDEILKPCTVGENGKSKPIEHVFKLQKGFKKFKLIGTREKMSFVILKIMLNIFHFMD
ncbi:hypothetical protein KQX54_013158 [Cotesia glomerata]|uniref:Uncharacterized protein n=1 Tax=Cotesia glomerata TaxID=32391 RepID=A0AAV7HYX3_COTGL|nr:hypothetical protein KQX54_013158 [Cotesia glomerata]